MGLDAMILVFWKLSFKPPFSLSSCTFIKKLFSSSLLSAVRVVSSAYLRLLIFLLAILIPAYASSSLAFRMMYSAYKLNKQGDNIQPWHTPFPIQPSHPVSYKLYFNETNKVCVYWFLLMNFSFNSISAQVFVFACVGKVCLLFARCYQAVLLELPYFHFVHCTLNFSLWDCGLSSSYKLQK